MKTIIAGSRDITDYSLVSEIIQNHDITEIVCGGARGVDAIGKAYGEANNIPVKMFPADWNLFGKSAGFRRNVQMAEYADRLIAVWDGKSVGTKNMIDYMRKINKPVSVYKV